MTPTLNAKEKNKMFWPVVMLFCGFGLTLIAVSIAVVHAERTGLENGKKFIKQEWAEDRKHDERIERESEDDWQKNDNPKDFSFFDVEPEAERDLSVYFPAGIEEGWGWHDGTAHYCGTYEKDGRVKVACTEMGSYEFPQLRKWGARWRYQPTSEVDELLPASESDPRP